MNTVIINSIGTATPGASKILSDALKVPQDYILKLLYSAPSVLFQKVDEDTALKAEDTLKKLGLDVSVCDEQEPLNLTTELVDISVSFEDVLTLPKVTEQLASFLGCKQAEVLNLLLNEPSIVLGNVSEATALAMKKRVNAHVHYANPKKDLYTILINTEIKELELKAIEKQLQVKLKRKGDCYVAENISYSDSQWLWRKYQTQDKVKLISQTHQLVTINLSDFDPENSEHISYLTNHVGIPESILSDIQQALPITLFEYINRERAEDLVEKAEKIGMEVALEKDFDFKKQLHITKIRDTKNVNTILAQFVSKDNLVKANAKEWKSRNVMPSLIARYLSEQLERVGCNTEIV
ncbi:hypothetical protein [Tenacibaculum jejuense]|uniref:Uncharacterized protein n=1 Tax=Tenacibaculum jejuense TaxID=584609 RepID=A0A238U4S7_9FLAO|nr:hypothetical protein [Tenacibaculum jejuense]SNR14102.1 protein of unknown function [Tenacibaculum jejuense]